MKNKPNFFIIGAPKCGTTALSEYLKTHPNIYVSEPKELHFFSSDFSKLSVAKTLSEYLSIFNKCNKSYDIVGESSVFYLYSDDAIKEIYKFNPSSKIIIMLRNPIDYIYSYHSQALYAGNENIEDFKKAWEMQAERREGRLIPKSCVSSKILQYKKAALFGEQVEKVLKIFPKEQVLFLLMDDMKKDMRQVYLNTLSFLGVEDDGKKDFPKINENKKHKLKIIGQLRNNPPKTLLKIIQKIKKTLRVENISLTKHLYEMNTQVVQREPLSLDFRQELLDEFLGDIEKLEKLIGRDLSHWKKI